MKHLSFFIAFVLWSLKNKEHAHIMARSVLNPDSTQTHSNNRMRVILYSSLCNISCAGHVASYSKQLSVRIILSSNKTFNLSSLTFNSGSGFTKGINRCSFEVFSDISKRYDSVRVGSDLTFFCSCEVKIKNHTVIMQQVDNYCVCELQNTTNCDLILKLLPINKKSANSTDDAPDLRDSIHQLIAQILNSNNTRTFFKLLGVPNNMTALLVIDFSRGKAEDDRDRLLHRSKRASIKPHERHLRDDTKSRTHSIKTEHRKGSTSNSPSPTHGSGAKHQKTIGQDKWQHLPPKEHMQELNHLQHQMKAEVQQGKSVKLQQMQTSESGSHDKNEINVTPTLTRNKGYLLNETEYEYKKFLREQTIRWQLRLHRQYAYLCLVFIICLMLFCLWYMRGFHSRNANKIPVTFHDESHLLTVKEVVYRRAPYLPMFNKTEPDWKEVFVHDCGNDP